MTTRRILKFDITHLGEIRTADEPRFLAVGWQGERLVVWVEATEGQLVTTHVAIVATGEAAPLASDRAEYVGTAQHPTLNVGGPLVLHVYRERRRLRGGARA